MTINEMIRKGCGMSYHKTDRTEYYTSTDQDGKLGACVLGALWLGASAGKPYSEAAVYEETIMLMGKAGLGNVATGSWPCPQFTCGDQYCLTSLCIHLNDDHEWSREAIAEWLDPHPELHISMPTGQPSQTEPVHATQAV